MEPEPRPADPERAEPHQREIPFNYTSADDRQALSLVLGEDILENLDALRLKRVTGRSARLLSRCFGEILVHRRNPYLFQEMLDSALRRKRFFLAAERDLGIIEQHADGEPLVLGVLKACRDLLREFRTQIRETPGLRRRLKRELGSIVGSRNIFFDPFALVSHATDATDWRLHLPVAVVMPAREEQVGPLLLAIGRLGLKAIPRGAGTGLTGGAVPLHPGCVIINTEKLNRIRGNTEQRFERDDGREDVASVVELEAGVITEKAMDYAQARGLVFATDPTSAWASTIGGNIAENAGGKRAVRWGTCLDNLVSWTMAMPQGQTWIIRRTDHHLRKVLPGDIATFEVADDQGALLRRIELRSDEIRKKGLWKDITNKVLDGLPGLQKEGTDGVITSARFVLYPEFSAQRTLCLEFFGPDMDEASQVILAISKAFPFSDEGKGALVALEHFDDEYVRAIGYKVKAPRAETPKAVLLVDVAGHSTEDLDQAVQRMKAILKQHPNTMLFVAPDASEAKRFWADRKQLGAIARRTNAFKLNEDVVIPLEALAEFARFVDQVNAEEERNSQIQFLDRAEVLFTAKDAEEAPFLDKVEAARERCAKGRLALNGTDRKTIRSMKLYQEIRSDLEGLARGYPELLEALEKTHLAVRNRRIVLATHMHAGDGNVHVNIPVLSNDRAMLRHADQVIDAVMAKVVELGGVVSGEHGIGITKLKYLDQGRLDALKAYRRDVDPLGLMNPGKLADHGALKRIFTPSFNLLELEARILQHGQLEELAKQIAYCVRCGKCKPECGVFHPARGMFFHPRNKNLAIGSLIEALLYDAQRERSTHFGLLPWLEDVADHCTICHKCLKPCPVEIDTGKVSVLEREILSSWGYKRTPLATRMTLSYLDSRSPFFNGLFRTVVLRVGGTAQRLGAALTKPVQPKDGASRPYALQMLQSPVPAVPSGTLRNALPICAPDQALLFEPTRAAEKTVFYFPGCGSERLHSTIAKAAIHVLLENATRVIVPPPFLCCGFPAHVNAKTSQHSRLVLRDTILFSQIRDMFAHFDFDACVVTCGTCQEGLLGMDADPLFGGRIVDLTSYVLERGLRLEGRDECLYHAPCHDSLGGKAAHALKQIGGFAPPESVPHCCSEAGTLALSRPDITGALLHRKREALQVVAAGPTNRRILTNCPSCLQGLGRNRDLGIEPCHLAVALAEKISGTGWLERFEEQAMEAVAYTF